VLDGLEHDPPTILASKFYEAAKFYSLTDHNYSPLAVYFSETTFNRMNPKLRDAFVEAASQAAIDTRAHGQAVTQLALQGLQQKGVTIIEVDKEAFRQRVEPQQIDRFVRQYPDAKAVIDMIQSASV
jgi:TRAP-type C4-dicarboxylate transport system substrate-binding protein